MALTQKLEFRQTQALVMTPQLMQAIKLLQLSNLDLAAYVEGELDGSALLARAGESGSDAVDASLQSTESERTATAEASGPDWLGEDLATSRTAIEDQLGTRLDNVFPDDSGELSARPGGEAP